MNWGEINDLGQVVGYSETDVLDPNGEDICGFGTGPYVSPVSLARLPHEALSRRSAEITGRRARSITVDKSSGIAETAVGPRMPA